MDTRNNDFDFDFTPIGQAIKKARTAKGMTREQLARIVDYDPRHLQAIENEGQKPSLELLIQLVTMFGVSVDEYIYQFDRNHSIKLMLISTSFLFFNKNIILCIHGKIREYQNHRYYQKF